ncbi:DUF6985 domain-containing protein [Butyrivibrio fibrisolvens]|uniref:DUF6985 domain-containing protein n=1 Tax=Butyrivibrio fibrisolvens TaxID=831 RepID=UPI0003B466B3|nr:hypothetical protein [Butyrivibrio fibrisolvens]
MNEKDLTIWGRKLNVRVIFDHYSGENILQEQKDSLRLLLENMEVVDNTLDDVKMYCLKMDGSEIDNKEIPNIFKYVMPQSIYVGRPDNKNICGVAVICSYRFDPEENIAISFRNNKFVKIQSETALI